MKNRKPAVRPIASKSSTAMLTYTRVFGATSSDLWTNLSCGTCLPSIGSIQKSITEVSLNKTNCLNVTDIQYMYVYVFSSLFEVYFFDTIEVDEKSFYTIV